MIARGQSLRSEIDRAELTFESVHQSSTWLRAERRQYRHHLTLEDPKLTL